MTAKPGLRGGQGGVEHPHARRSGRATSRAGAASSGRSQEGADPGADRVDAVPVDVQVEERPRRPPCRRRRRCRGGRARRRRGSRGARRAADRVVAGGVDDAGYVVAQHRLEQGTGRDDVGGQRVGQGGLGRDAGEVDRSRRAGPRRPPRRRRRGRCSRPRASAPRPGRSSADHLVTEVRQARWPGRVPIEPAEPVSRTFSRRVRLASSESSSGRRPESSRRSRSSELSSESSSSGCSGPPGRERRGLALVVVLGVGELATLDVEGAVGVVDLGAVGTVVGVEAALALLLHLLLGVLVGLLVGVDAQAAAGALVGVDAAVVEDAAAVRASRRCSLSLVSLFSSPCSSGSLIWVPPEVCVPHRYRGGRDGCQRRGSRPGRTEVRCAGTMRPSSSPIRVAAARPASSTSSWLSGSPVMPAARLVTRRDAEHLHPGLAGGDRLERRATSRRGRRRWRAPCRSRPGSRSAARGTGRRRPRRGVGSTSRHSARSRGL